MAYINGKKVLGVMNTSGGGGGSEIPTINFNLADYPQDGDIIQVTSEQKAIIENNDIIKIGYVDDGANTWYGLYTKNQKGELQYISLDEDGTNNDIIIGDKLYYDFEDSDTLEYYTFSVGGGGKQLYQHNIELVYRGHNYNLVIPSESDTLINTPTKLQNWFNANYNNKDYRMVGFYLITSTAYLIVKSIKVNNATIYVSGLLVDNGTPTSQTGYAITGDFANFTITDNVIPL